MLLFLLLTRGSPHKFADSFSRIGGKSLRNRVEHAQVINVDDIPRFKTLNIIPAMQPTHATSDMNIAEDRVGANRLKGAYTWQTFLKQGSPVAFGSDFPVELSNPFFGLHAAMTRQDRNNTPDSGWISSEAVTVKQAFRGFTLDAAYAAHQEKILGGLTEGKWATLSKLIYFSNVIYTQASSRCRFELLKIVINSTAK